jgi:hypothetical protein
MHDLHAQGRLHLLRDDEQHPGLLRLLLSAALTSMDAQKG